MATVPEWNEAMSTAPRPPSQQDEPADFLRGWQRRASHACDERALETHLADLSPASRALLLSQAGPHSARALMVLPTCEDVVVPASHFRVLLLRRLRLPLDFGPRSCFFFAFAAAHLMSMETTELPAPHLVSGVLASRALPLERAIARVCQEAGARVGRNVALSAMNIDVPVHDARRIQVVCNGLPLWHGAQLAVDATLVSPLTRDGRPHDGADARPGWAFRNAARREQRQTYPELGHCRRCRLVVFGLEVGGRWWHHFRRGAARARCLQSELGAAGFWLARGPSTQPPTCPCLERRPPGGGCATCVLFYPRMPTPGTQQQSAASRLYTIMLNGSRTPVCTQWCVVGTCRQLMLATADWPAVAIILSAMSAVPVIKATPSGLAGFVLVMQTLLRMLFFIAPHTVLCENGGVLEPDQGNCSTCQRYLARPQSPTVPARLRTMYALLPVYTLPLRHVKCDATDALHRTVVSRLMV